MAFINPSDMVEEDAADLQFPKEPDIITVRPGKQTEHAVQYFNSTSSIVSYNQFTEKCCICKCAVEEPYINCAECHVFLCLQCFSCGSETNLHRNTHSYTIKHGNVQVFPSTNWNALEEKKLLDLILSCGYGNWEDIAKALGYRTPVECQEHYQKFYFGSIFEEVLGLTKNPYFPQRIPYVYKMKNVDPPRHDLDSINFKNMSGYRCARGDFDIPYDNSAESMISNLDIEDWHDWKSITDELHCAIFKAYNHRLIERNRRYKIMRDHGLLVASKTLGWLSKYSDAIGCTQSTGKFGRTGRFVAFMQITDPTTFDGLVESLQYYNDLKKYIFKLYDMRANGIRTFAGGKLYQKLKNKRLLKIRNKKIVQYENSLDWRNFINCATLSNTYLLSNSFTTSSQPRRKAAPLEILGLSGYDKLTEDERNLCKVSRIVPAAYLEYKNILTSENARAGYLRLADARRLIKIDVNKTRQIYDFLLNHGFINKPL